MKEQALSTETLFEATQMGIPFRRPKWKVGITPELVQFARLDGKEHIKIPREQGKECIELTSAFVSGHNVKVNKGGKNYEFKLTSKDLTKLRDWLPPKTVSDLRGALVARGVGLILTGIAHFVFSSYLDPTWGGVLIGVGVLNLFIISRYTFIANGLLLILASCMNVYVAAAEGVGGLGGFGIFQFAWGLEELVRVREYASVKKE